jgi:hypothetical protein
MIVFNRDENQVYNNLMTSGLPEIVEMVRTYPVVSV